MKKYNFLVAMFLCAMGTSVLLAASLTGSAGSTSLGDGGIDDGSSTITSSASTYTGKSKVAKAAESKQSGMATLPNGTAYVGVYGTLNVRDDVWGNVLGELKNNESVTILGRDGDWYKAKTSKGQGYVHARYIFSTKNKRYHGNEVDESNNPKRGGSSEVVMNVSGDSIQAKVVSAAKNLVSKYATPSSFPYDPLTKGGSLGCAQVVTTALKAAGVLKKTSLGCVPTKGMLKNVGWSVVKAPPYQAGDVIFWSTYDSSGDGVKDPDTHIGIIMSSGNNVQAMSNSSSQKRPRFHSAEYAPVTTVMRKC